ncbi:MAG: hypothetical protein DRP10_03340 [Candidatus Aenigmatarchaeota archaeon]|nr:MAG: hypothetical protein DRP10_03340 [Candidatus Aenigmarchaeota archaeon]
MRVVVTSMGKNMDSEVSPVFARCPYFIIAEIENKEIKKTEAIENESARQFGGAGISAAQRVAEKKVNSVITGNIGPRASMVLNRFNIKVYRGSGTVKESLLKFIENKLENIQ